MPVLRTRSIRDFPIGNRPLAAHHPPGINCQPDAWLDSADLNALNPSGPTTLLAADQRPLAWFGDSPDPESAIEAASSFIIVHTWDLLHASEMLISRMKDHTLKGMIHPMAIIDGVVDIGRGTRILPGVFIEGQVIIGSNCKIGPNCYIRGNTSIGDHCHIGQSVEIKNSIILSDTNIGHLSYVGDSIIGEKVNLGAGTVTSNLRHDGKNHRTFVDGELVDTGRRKFGTIIGDGVHTGINTSIYPGRKLFPGTTTRPGEIVKHDLHESL